MNDLKNNISEITKWGSEKVDTPDNSQLLHNQLIELQRILLQFEDVFDQNVNLEPPENDKKSIMSFVIMNFPNFGYYNLARDVTVNIGETELVIGDARDDLSDIIDDLETVLWCFENTSEADAIWHLRFGYSSHWGKHLNDLSNYLFNIQFES